MYSWLIVWSEIQENNLIQCSEIPAVIHGESAEDLEKCERITQTVESYFIPKVIAVSKRKSSIWQTASFSMRTWRWIHDSQSNEGNNFWDPSSKVARCPSTGMHHPHRWFESKWQPTRRTERGWSQGIISCQNGTLDDTKPRRTVIVSPTIKAMKCERFG
jgi:hypothetical protein